MAGILANSAAQTMTVGLVDNTQSGFVTGQMVTLTTTPTGASYSWGQAIPSGSAAARSELSASTGASVTFTPDVGGYYTITCDVAGTVYILRLSVAAAAATIARGAINLLPLADSAVPAPALGVTLYYSSTQSALVVKYTNNTVHPITVT